MFVNKATHNIEVQRCNFRFPVLQGSAETLVRLGGKLYNLSIAYFLINIPAKILKSSDPYSSYN